MLAKATSAGTPRAAAATAAARAAPFGGDALLEVAPAAEAGDADGGAAGAQAARRGWNLGGWLPGGRRASEVAAAAAAAVGLARPELQPVPSDPPLGGHAAASHRGLAHGEAAAAPVEAPGDVLAAVTLPLSGSDKAAHPEQLLSSIGKPSALQTAASIGRGAASKPASLTSSKRSAAAAKKLSSRRLRCVAVPLALLVLVAGVGSGVFFSERAKSRNYQSRHGGAAPSALAGGAHAAERGAARAGLIGGIAAADATAAAAAADSSKHTVVGFEVAARVAPPVGARVGWGCADVVGDDAYRARYEAAFAAAYAEGLDLPAAAVQVQGTTCAQDADKNANANAAAAPAAAAVGQPKLESGRLQVAEPPVAKAAKAAAPAGPYVTSMADMEGGARRLLRHQRRRLLQSGAAPVTLTTRFSVDAPLSSMERLPAKVALAGPGALRPALEELLGAKVEVKAPKQLAAPSSRDAAAPAPAPAPAPESAAAAAADPGPASTVNVAPDGKDAAASPVGEAPPVAVEGDVDPYSDAAVPEAANGGIARPEAASAAPDARGADGDETYTPNAPSADDGALTAVPDFEEAWKDAPACAPALGGDAAALQTDTMGRLWCVNSAFFVEGGCWWAAASANGEEGLW